ncbi:MAG: GNVR domain-containing protein [Desulfobacterales bacterium]|nr:GNVR domain-containing protein [Desulfobacterales bacterium]
MKDLSQIDFTSPATIWEIISRRRWFIIVSMTVAIVVGSYLAIVMPKLYFTQTVILVEPQRVPEKYVKSLVTDDINSRIQTIAQQILSRTNLENIITQFNLFSDPVFDNVYIEDKVSMLKDHVSVAVRSGRRKTASASFTIGVKNKDPKLAMHIANALAASFISENLKVRETQALSTSEFLDSELATMRIRLQEQEQKLANYRRAHMGEMPEQLDTNLKIIQVLQDEMQKKEDDLQNLQNRLYEMNELVAEGKSALAATGQPSIENLRRQLIDLEARYTPRHPDIIRLKQMIIELENRPLDINNDDQMNPLDDIGAQIAATIAEIDEIRNQIAIYKQRVEATPKRQLDLISLNRDYNNIRRTYQSLLDRKLEAEIAVNMERKQKGEQFRVLDRAVEPHRPTEPDMQRLFLIVLASGLGLGCGLALLFELFDDSFRSPEELEKALELPILAMVPVLTTVRTRILTYAHNGSTVIAVAIVILLTAGFWSLIFQGIGPTFELLDGFLPERLVKYHSIG